MKRDSWIYVAGHRGLVGSALMRQLHDQGYQRTLVFGREALDLRDRAQVRAMFEEQKPEYVFLCAAKVGGIVANRDNSAAFMLENLQIQNNVIEAAADFGTKKLLFTGSACAYPKYAQLPILEESLLTGSLEPTNQCYAIAKIAGIKLCRAYYTPARPFVSVMPTNLYGIGDHYDLENSHVLPGMVRRMHEAKMRGKDVTLWGTGKPTREFLFSDDLAQALITVMREYTFPDLMNISSGEEITLSDLAQKVAEAVDFRGKIIWDDTKPDGTPRRVLNNSRVRSLGWRPRVSLTRGLELTYEDFLCRQH